MFHYLHRDDASGLVTIGFGVIICIQGLQDGVHFIGEAGGVQGVEVKAEIIQHELQLHLDGGGL